MLSHFIFKDHKSVPLYARCTVPALSCGRKHGQENMGRESINQSRKRRISMRTSLQATTTRCELMKTQGILILYVCLCGFPAASIFAQDHRADSKGLYLQCTRTFHTVGEFNRLTKGKVKLHRGAWCRKCSGDVRSNTDDLLIGSSFGVALQLPGQKPMPYVLLTWAPDNPVTTLAAKFRGDVWIG